MRETKWGERERERERESVWDKASVRSWLTIFRSDTKVPFSIASRPRCRRGRYSLSWIVLFTLDPQLIMQSIK